MRLRTGAVTALTSLVWIVGCQEPPDLVPVVPPGVELKRMPKLAEDETAQALGEEGAIAAGSEGLPTVSKEVSPPTKPGEPKTLPSGLVYETAKEGSGPEAKPGQTVRVHYTGTLADGKKFDSSRDRDQPLEFPLGMGHVIRGWDIGVSGMRVGEQRKLIVPPDLGYGAAGNPPTIPRNATLFFDVELVGVK